MACVGGRFEEGGYKTAKFSLSGLLKNPPFIEIACNGGTIFEGKKATCCIEVGELCFAYIRYHFLKSIFMGMLEFAQNLPLLR